MHMQPATLGGVFRAAPDDIAIFVDQITFFEIYQGYLMPKGYSFCDGNGGGSTTQHLAWLGVKKNNRYIVFFI